MELFYNPQRMSETEIKETFVANQWLVEEIISLVQRQPKGAGVQHAIVVAPRGMGKTTLLLMLRFAVLESELAKSWQPLLFPEESYNVYELADFWLAVLEHVSAATGDSELEQDIAELKARHRNSDELEEAALARIKDWRNKNKKGLLTLVDSLDLILDQIGDERDNARLRDVLMNDGSLMLVGCATTFFKEARNYEQPLYNLFKVYNLQSLTSAQIHELLRRRAKLDGEENFDQVLRANASRLRVLEYFTGGNPRLVMMLYRVLTHSELSEVRRGLEKLLDEVTPYYKAKIENLPPQQRKLLDHIARITAITREGLTPTEIAAATRLPVNQVSAQLQRLSEAGYVRAANIRSRSSYYTLSEPLYAIWHQMRFGRDARRHMEWLVTFLKGWYDAQELDSECQRLQNVFRQYLATGRMNEARDVLEHQRYLVSALDNGKEQFRSLEEVILSYLELKDVEVVKRELAEIDSSQLSHKTQLRLVEEGLLTQTRVRQAPSHQLLAGGKNEQILANQIRLAFDQLVNGDVEEATQILKRAESLLQNQSAGQLISRALVMAVARKPKGVAISLNQIELKPVAAVGWWLVGLFFLLSSQLNEAVEAFLRVTVLDPSNFLGWHYRALLQETLGEDEGALKSIDQALQIDPNSERAQLARGRILESLNRHHEALFCLDRLVQLNPKSSEARMSRGIALLGLQRFSEALVDFEKACELEADAYDAFLLRAVALDFLERYEDELTILNTALKLNSNSFDAYYLRGQALTSMNRVDEALQSYREAFAVSSTDDRTFANDTQATSIKLRLALIDNDFRQAKIDWEQLREFAYKEGGEAFWFETVSTLVRDTTDFEQREFLRRLIGTSTADEPLFPLARALDYVIHGDEALIEKLSPEVRRIVDEIVDSLQKSASSRTSKKKQTRRPKRRNS